jgi:hypothetical protein
MAELGNTQVLRKCGQLHPHPPDWASLHPDYASEMLRIPPKRFD